MPTYQNSPSGQILTICDKSFLIDCGEGVQLTMRKLGIHTSRLYSVFISHLHGDHCFGLIGLISTFGMMGRSQPLHIYAHPDLEKMLRPQMNYYCADLPYEVVFHPINPRKEVVIFEDRTITVSTIPLKHSVPCCGFLFVEKHRGLPARKRYAYCSDTAINLKMIPQIKGVDLLYHEATYTEEHKARAAKTMHSTALQAASMAKHAEVGKLMIGHYSARIDDHQAFLKEAQSFFEDTVLAVEKETIQF